MTGKTAHPALQDLYDRVHLGLARGGALLHEAERTVIDRLLGLDPDAALLLARLAGRRGPAWRLPDLKAAGVDRLDAAVSALVAVGLVDHEVPDADRLQRATRDQLVAGCRRLGLSPRGTREVLASALAEHPDWDDAPWIRLAEAPLLLRLFRWATLQVRPDASTPVLDRMGVVRWYSYPPTAGSILPHRAAWDAWEQLVERWDALTGEDVLRALDAESWPPGGLDLRRALGERGLELADALRREGHFVDAAALLEGLAARPGRWRDEAVLRRVRLLARQRQPADARAVALAAGLDDPASRRALERTLRGLQGGAGGLVPSPPLARAADRELRLDGCASDALRPRFGEHHETVEAAVIRALSGVGRRALFAEGGLWRTVLGLLFAEVMFTPVDGQLPVPYLSGPLDWGTPAFVARRADAVAAVWAEVEAGHAPRRLADAATRLAGTVIRGVRWDLASADDLVAVAAAMPGAALRALLEPLLLHGSRAARGLPDLVVLPGARHRLAGAFPSALPEALCFVEVKTPNDALRDEQAVWHDRLLRAGLVVERWQVSAAQPRSASLDAAYR